MRRDSSPFSVGGRWSYERAPCPSSPCASLAQGEPEWSGRGSPPSAGWASFQSTRAHTLTPHRALPQAPLYLLLTTLRGGNIGAISQAEAGVQPHPVTQSSCSDLVPHGQDRSAVGAREQQRGRGPGVGNVEATHLVGAQKPEEGLSPHSFHGSEEPGLRLRSRAAMLPWKQRVPLSLTAGITVIGVGVGGGCFPGSTKGWG